MSRALLDDQLSQELAADSGFSMQTRKRCSSTRPVSTGVVGAPIPSEHRRHADELSGRGRVYLQAFADVDTDMAYPGLVCVGEKNEVTRLWNAYRNRGIELIEQVA